jgi:predicted RNase H-like nuclease (RuvC/YqgF family)
MQNVSFKDKFKQLEVENKLLSERVSRLLELNKKGLSESHDNLLTYLRKDNLRLYGEDMAEHRRKAREFEAKQKEVNLLAEELEKELAQLKVGKPDKSNSEYQKERTIKLQQVEIKHLKRKLKAERRKVEKLKNRVEQ